MTKHTQIIAGIAGTIMPMPGNFYPQEVHRHGTSKAKRRKNRAQRQARRRQRQ